MKRRLSQFLCLILAMICVVVTTVACRPQTPDNEPDMYWTKVIPQPPEDFPYYEVTGGEPYNWRHGKAPVPVYKAFDGKVLWGLTGRITKRFTDVVKGDALHV